MGYPGWFGETWSRFEYVFIPYQNIIHHNVTAVHKQGDLPDRLALTSVKSDPNNLFLGEGRSLATVLARRSATSREFDHVE
jgi:hypothetical protein